MKYILVCVVVCTLLLMSCGSTSTTPQGNGTHTAGMPTPDTAAPPGNFLYASSSGAIFLAWVNTNGSLSGQTQDASLQNSNDGSEQVKSTHGSFTGILTNGQVSLNFDGFLGCSSTVTGTYDGTTLTLNIPTQDGV